MINIVEPKELTNDASIKADGGLTSPSTQVDAATLDFTIFPPKNICPRGTDIGIKILTPPTATAGEITFIPPAKASDWSR